MRNPVGRRASYTPRHVQHDRATWYVSTAQELKTRKHLKELQNFWKSSLSLSLPPSLSPYFFLYFHSRDDATTRLTLRRSLASAPQGSGVHEGTPTDSAGRCIPPFFTSSLFSSIFSFLLSSIKWCQFRPDHWRTQRLKGLINVLTVLCVLSDTGSSIQGA